VARAAAPVMTRHYRENGYGGEEIHIGGVEVEWRDCTSNSTFFISTFHFSIRGFSFLY
jgi:hypothetical protein